MQVHAKSDECPKQLLAATFRQMSTIIKHAITVGNRMKTFCKKSVFCFQKSEIIGIFAFSTHCKKKWKSEKTFCA